MIFMNQLAALAKAAEAKGETALLFGMDEAAARYFQISEVADDLALRLMETSARDSLMLEEVP